MDRLTGCTADSTDWEGFGDFFGIAVVAFAFAFDDHLNLPIETSSAAFDQRYLCSQAHLVYMTSGIEIVKGVEDDVESTEIFNIELRIFDVGMVRFELDLWVEFGGAFLRDL